MELSATIPALLERQAASFGSETILRKKDRGIWKSVSWLELEARVQEIGQGLRAAGLTSGEVVAILSETRPELVYADLAILGCGAASVAIHTDEEAARVGDILRDTGAAIAIVEGEEQLDKVLGIRAECPALRRIVIMDMKGLRDFRDPACGGLAELIASGMGQSDWKAAVSAVSADQPAAILVPGPGETGPGEIGPEETGAGQPITHAQILRRIDEVAGTMGVRTGDERLAVLPMCDPTERVLGLYLALKHRIVSNYLENPETATENLREVKPTVFGADTEAWERLHSRTTALVDAATGVQKALYRWAIGAGAGGGPGGMLANLLVLSAVRGTLGFGRLRVAHVGDAALSPEIEQWARALGITVRHINPFQQGSTHV